MDYFHIPVIVSFPHFYLADPTVLDSVGGMHPVAEEHETAVDVEPVSLSHTLLLAHILTYTHTYSHTLTQTDRHTDRHTHTDKLE